ncbi:hypothetical protein AOQ71_29265 [Bradyrhizobium manausense]|uniref:Carrier domain-containing protein n=2 Tax=Bradyrhizobium manausense TaxID=989370 RepID=A0A0R3D5J1_9BRAD|nr:hypothetical protein AOQ71_29265 [Bradyrhizobium manausense]
MRAAEMRCTVGTLLTGVFAMALAKASGLKRFLIGMAASDRPEKRFEDTFGFFVNWLPLRIDLSRHETITEFLVELNRERLSALAEAHIPFDRIVSAVGCERRADRHPLFQFMFVSHVPARRVEAGNLQVSIEPLFGGAAKLDLTMFFTDADRAVAVEGRSSRMCFEIEYARRLFDSNTIIRFSETFLSIAESVAADPTTRVLTEIPDGPRYALARGVNIQCDPSPLHAIARAIERTPDAIATRAQHEWPQTRTFREIGANAVAVAEALERAGVTKGNSVCTLQSRGADTIVVLLGIMLAGAVYVPLDPAQPDQRLAAFVRLARPAAIFSCPRNRTRAERLGGGAKVLVSEASTAGASTSWASRLSRIVGTDPAYLFFTSGSSGQPKGVLGAHAPLANFCVWLASYLDLSASDVVPCKSSVAFDASFRETISTLVGGAQLALLSDEEAADSHKLLTALHREHATVLHATPTLYREILAVIEELRRDTDCPDLLRTLQGVMLGGEALDAALAALHARLLPTCVLYNVYGPTECTVDVTAHEIRSTTTEAEIPIGKPIQNVSIAILGADRRPLSVGEEGEIAIVGSAVALGYCPNLNEDEARRFTTAIDIGLEQEARVFLTGDYGILREDGSLLFRGRRDRQVQIWGMRVELDEIEAALLGLDDVAQAAVIHQKGPRGTYVVAFVEPKTGCVPRGPGGWRMDLAARLPAAMIPAVMEERERLPRLPSGKIDRGALSSVPAAERSSSYDLSPESQLVLELMQDLLGADLVSPTVSFFAQGGHSLNAVRLVARANRAFGRSLTVKEFFAHPTAVGFGQRLAEAPIRVVAAGGAPARASRPRRPLNG